LPETGYPPVFVQFHQAFPAPTYEQARLYSAYRFVVNPYGKLMTEYRRYADGKTVIGNYDRLYDLIYEKNRAGTDFPQISNVYY